MGWKAIKDTFSIKHVVHVNDNFVCIIGSPLVPKIVWIDPVTGKVNYESDFGLGLVKEQYPALFRADPEYLLALLNKEDAFDVSIPVYVYQDGLIVEKFCEATEWPNVTHDGVIMYENEYYTDKQEAIASAKNMADMDVASTIKHVEQAEKDLAALKSQLVWKKAEQLALNVNYPDEVVSSSR